MLGLPTSAERKKTLTFDEEGVEEGVEIGEERGRIVIFGEEGVELGIVESLLKPVVAEPGR